MITIIKDSGYIERLLELSFKDLESSKILYKSEIYEMSLYHLQQTVEKIIKAYGMIYFGVKKDQIENEIRHTSPLAFLLPIYRMTDQINSIIQNLPEIKRDYELIRNAENIILHSSLLQQIKETKSEKKQSALLRNLFNEQKQNIVLQTKEDIEILFKRAKLYSISIRKDQIVNLVPDFYEYKMKQENKDILDKDTIEVIIKMFIDSIIEKIDFYHFFILFELATLTFPYAVLTRYPDDFFDRLKFEEIGIIQAFSICTEILEEILKKVQSDLAILKIFDVKEIEE